MHIIIILFRGVNFADFWKADQDKINGKLMAFMKFPFVNTF